MMRSETNAISLNADCRSSARPSSISACELLDRLGIDYQMLESGCCGMAGGFGFEAGAHYDVSLKAGERVLLPAVRAAPKGALIIADGFSCRMQIAALTDRRTLHPAQVAQMALCVARLAAREYPETGRYAARPTRLGARDKAALGAGAVLVGALAVWAIKRRRASKTQALVATSSRAWLDAARIYYSVKRTWLAEGLPTTRTAPFRCN